MDINKCLENNPNYYSDIWKAYHQARIDYNLLTPPPIDEFSFIIYRHFSGCGKRPIPLHAINLANELKKGKELGLNLSELITSLKQLKDV